MSDLHAALATKLDELGMLAQHAYDAEPGGWSLHHNATRTGRADEWEIRDSDLDSLAWVGAENDARLIVAAASPDTVLHAIAEDRDILTRHTAGRWPSVEDGYDAPTCIGCGRDDQGDPRYLVPCPEVLSLARRHGIEVA